MGLLSNLGSAIAELVRGKPAVEGEYRDGPYWLPVSKGWLSAEAGQHLNWWQLGHNIERSGPTSMVEACVSAYAQTMAMLPGNHWRLNTDTGGRERIGNSALARFLRKPNTYQSISDFELNVVRHLLLRGNAYAVAQRNDRNEIVAAHLMHPDKCKPLLAETGDIFYDLGGNPVVEKLTGMEKIRVPARDVLHLRLHTPEHPLIGVSPITATAIQQAMANSVIASQVRFFTNQSRPSYILSTDHILTREQTQELRALWDEQSKGMNQGGTPVLSAGLKPQPIGMSAQDAQLIELLKLSDSAVAQVFRIPPVIIGLGQVNMASTESLMQFWLSTGLGFMLNHVEEAVGLWFGLKGQPDEYLEKDTQALLRSNFKDRVEAYVRSVQGGLHSPDEARNELELDAVPGGYGKEPRVQQQVVPLSAWEKGQTAKPPTAPNAPQPGAPTPKPQPGADDDDGDDDAPQPERSAGDYIERAQAAAILGEWFDG